MSKAEMEKWIEKLSSDPLSKAFVIASLFALNPSVTTATGLV
jgi:hypothetical protein